MSVTVGIMTFNSETMLPDLLRSLEAGLHGVDDWNLVIADSGSTDGTVELARRLARSATVIPLGRNVGFAAAINAIAKTEPSSGAMLLLSPTTRLHYGCVAHMLDTMDGLDVGIVVPRLVNGSGNPSMSLRRRPTLPRAWAEALLGGNIARRLGLSEMIPNPVNYGPDTRAEWATGAVTMVSRKCLEKVGPWDESFFLYSEETDYGLRARDCGFRLVLASQAVAVHLGGVSRVRPELWALTCANKVRLYGMRHKPAAAWLFWGAIVFGEFARSSGRRGRIRRAALGKLLREARALVHGEPARHPYGLN